MGLSPDRRRKDAFLSDAGPRRARVALLASWRRTRAVWLLLALVAVAAAVDTVRLWQQQRWNDSIDASSVPARDNHKDLPPEVQFAQAYALAASGAGEAARQRYHGLLDDTRLGQAARYNSANLLMREAVVARGVCSGRLAQRKAPTARTEALPVLNQCPDGPCPTVYRY